MTDATDNKRATSSSTTINRKKYKISSENIKQKKKIFGEPLSYCSRANPPEWTVQENQSEELKKLTAMLNVDETTVVIKKAHQWKMIKKKILKLPLRRTMLKNIYIFVIIFTNTYIIQYMIAVEAL